LERAVRLCCVENNNAASTENDMHFKKNCKHKGILLKCQHLECNNRAARLRAFSMKMWMHYMSQDDDKDGFWKYA